MRVLYAQAHPRDESLGSPKSVLRLGPPLAALGYEVDFLFQTDLHPRLRNHRLLPVVFPLIVLGHVLRRACDIVDIASGDAFLAGAVQRLRHRDRPTVVSRVLGMEHLDWAERQRSHRLGQDFLRWRYRIWFSTLRLTEVEASIRLSRHVLCLCQQDKSHIVRSGWRGPADVTVVPPGVDRQYLAAEPAKLESRTLLFLGSWIARKGIHALAAALPQVLARVPDARLVVAGSGASPERVLQSFPESVGHAIYVAPRMPAHDLAALMRQCAVMAMPSLYEGFGMAFLEAMAVGLPVVGTPTGGMADLIHPDWNGLLVPPRDPSALATAIIRLLENSEYRYRLGRGARATALPYTWERTARDTAAIYRQLVV